MVKFIRCPWCAGIPVIIDRFDHSLFYTCPLCKGKKKVRVEVEPA